MYCIAKLVDSCIGEICVMGLLWNSNVDQGILLVKYVFLDPHLSLAIRH